LVIVASPEKTAMAPPWASMPAEPAAPGAPIAALALKTQSDTARFPVTRLSKLVASDLMAPPKVSLLKSLGAPGRRWPPMAWLPRKVEWRRVATPPTLSRAPPLPQPRVLTPSPPGAPMEWLPVKVQDVRVSVAPPTMSFALKFMTAPPGASAPG